MSVNESELIDEELTAYLDGELPAVQSTSLEQRLVDDARLRQRLAELRQAYDMLDELPVTPRNQAFTQTTIAMVVADLKKSSSQTYLRSASPPPRTSWLRWPVVLLPTASMLVLGTVLGALAAALQTRFELSKLGLIANVPGLQDVRELTVAVQLAKDKELIDFLADRYSERMIPVLPQSLWQRRNWVLSLNPTQMATLESGQELMMKLPPDTVARMDAIQSQIDLHPDADTVNQTVRIVGAVLDSLSRTKRQDLESLEAEERTRFLTEQLCFRAAMQYAAEMASEDVAALEAWSKNELMPVLMANMPFLRREIDVRNLLMSLSAFRPVEDGFRLGNQDELIASLASDLTPFARRLVEGIDRNDQLIVISTWLVPEGIYNQKRLLETYDRMRRDSREEIDIVDPKQSQRMLRDRSRMPSVSNRNR